MQDKKYFHTKKHRPKLNLRSWFSIYSKLGYSVKRSDVTGNRFEWELDERKVIYDPLPHTSLY